MRTLILILAMLSANTIARAETFNTVCELPNSDGPRTPILINTQTREASVWTPGEMDDFSFDRNLSTPQAWVFTYGYTYSFDPTTLVLHPIDTKGKSVANIHCDVATYDSRENISFSYGVKAAKGSNLPDDQKENTENIPRVVVHRSDGKGSDGKTYQFNPGADSGSNCWATGTEIYNCD